MTRETTDAEFIKIVRAATVVGDGRARHIKAYKRLLRIIEKRDAYIRYLQTPEDRMR